RVSGSPRLRPPFPLGQYSGPAVVLSPVWGEKRVSVLQFSLEIPRARLAPAGIRDTDGPAVLSCRFFRDDRAPKVSRSGRRRAFRDWRKQSHRALAESSPGLPGI